MENQILNDFNDSVENLEDNFLNSSLIQDNKVIFPIDTKLFRVRMPNQSEQSNAEEYRNTRQIEIISSGKCATRKKLIKMLKENDVVDIQQLEEEKDKTIKQLQSVWINLATKHSSEIKTIEKFKTEEKQLREKIKELSLEISEHLISSLETQLEKAYMEYITAMCTEKCIGDQKWVKNWNSFEDYKKDETVITDKAITYMTWLLLNLRG